MSFATLFKLFYLEVLHLSLSLDNLDFNNLSFCSIVTVFKGVLFIVLDEWFPHPLPIDSGSYTTNGRNKTELLMEGKSSKSTQSSLSESDLQGTSQNMSKTLRSMWDTLGELEKLKESKNIMLCVSNQGSLEIDVPANMSDTEAADISDKVATLDRTYNDKLDQYKELGAKDQNITNDFSNPYKKVLDKHVSVYKDK